MISSALDRSASDIPPLPFSRFKQQTLGRKKENSETKGKNGKEMDLKSTTTTDATRREDKGNLGRRKAGTTEQVSHAVCSSQDYEHNNTKGLRKKDKHRRGFLHGKTGQNNQAFSLPPFFPTPWFLTVVQGERECIVACPTSNFLRPFRLLRRPKADLSGSRTGLGSLVCQGWWVWGGGETPAASDRPAEPS